MLQFLSKGNKQNIYALSKFKIINCVSKRIKRKAIHTTHALIIMGVFYKNFNRVTNVGNQMGKSTKPKIMRVGQMKHMHLPRVHAQRITPPLPPVLQVKQWIRQLSESHGPPMIGLMLRDLHGINSVRAQYGFRISHVVKC